MFIGSCQKTTKKHIVNVEQEISKLNNAKAKSDYLENIFTLDQNIRNGKEADLLNKYGINSKEIREHKFEMDSIDKLNYRRIESYLERYGYPSKDSVSKIASYVPWLVIHHNSDNSKRKKYFKTLRKAYVNEDINTGQFDLYLRRTYYIEFGQFPKWEGAYDPNEKIEWLIKALKLE